ncbi:MAG: ABC transporter permease, partial [Candidatus Nanopelagicales bacterium]
MLPFIVRRLIAMVLMLFALSVLTFLMFSVIPSDPARLTCGKVCTPQLIEANRHRLGLDEPLVTQYTRFAVGIPCGRIYPAEGAIFQCPVINSSLQAGPGQFECPAPCLGYSFLEGEDVTFLIKEALPPTVVLAIGAFILWMIGGITIGIFAALRRGRWQDRTAMGFSLIGYSFPSFFIGYILLYFVIFKFSLLPYPKYTPFVDDPLQWLNSFILPWITLAMLYAAYYVRLTRNQMLETLGDDYIRTARAKGLPERTVIYRHGFRAGLTPIVTSAGLDL